MAKFKNLVELFEDPKHWTKGAFARDVNGIECHESAPEAVSWCLIGGINKIYSHKTASWDKIFKKLSLATDKLLGLDRPSLFNINDEEITTHADILRLVKEAGI